MKDSSSNVEAKKQAALHAASLVEDKMLVGLGTGSTAAFCISELGRRVQAQELGIRCVATSFQSTYLAREAGLSVLPLDNLSRLDISIDGADRIDSRLNLIKGGGAAHTREKLVHSMSDRFIVVADSSKLVEKLDDSFPVPVEVLPDSVAWVKKSLLDLGARQVQMRMAVKKDGPVITDNGMIILDTWFDEMEPGEMEKNINSIAGVLENGIFSLSRPAKGDCIIGSLDGLIFY